MVETTQIAQCWSFLTHLRNDRGGNTLALIAAGLVPLLALVGGGIDMGRSYLSQSRLQQACDSGVLAARKKLGSGVVIDGEIPAGVAEVGNRFFNLNFRNGSYGTESRAFEMTLEEDYAISGVATVDVPTTIMTLFGYTQMPISVKCEARLNFSNTDVMFVLDTTGSMARTNSGDDASRIEILREVVKSFHAQLEGSKTPGTRVRYGFVPYSSNVNVGRLLDPDWMVDTWTYQGRVLHDTGETTTGPVFSETWSEISGIQYVGATNTSLSCPDDSLTWNSVRTWTDADGTENTEYIVNGTSYSCRPKDSESVKVTPYTYTDYRYIYRYRDEGTQTIPVFDWTYQPVSVDVSSLKGPSGPAGSERIEHGSIMLSRTGGDPGNATAFETWFRGCIEERQTYKIDDFDDVDLTRALDLDIDLVPTPGDPATQWRPMLHELSWVRAMESGGDGSFSIAPANYEWDYFNAGWAGNSPCPAEAQKLQEMTATQVSDYVGSLFPDGNTYHDIGMIWGGRLLSPTGLFASENADVGGKPTSRHLIFLTDGQTAPRDITYGTYGVEPISENDNARYTPPEDGGSFTLTEVVEGRFGVACNEVKKRNITIWVVSFGVSLNPILTECAGPGRAFEADDAAELNDVFSKIATQLGELRISK